MVYIFLAFFVLFIVILFMLYCSYTFQFFLHRYKIKKGFLEDFRKLVKGKYVSEAYFCPSHKIISLQEYRSLSNRQKVNFSECYNVIRFKTIDIDWELYFNLIRDGMSFAEVLNLRAFPKDYKIKSEGNAEMNCSMVNIFTNNRYLTKVLEVDVKLDIEYLIKKGGDNLFITYNNLHYKSFLDSSKISKSRVMDMIKSINSIKSKVYKKDILEY
jgi:hypothetical protein